ncbi:MAG: RelA/SpoT family protein [Bacteroidales bacterium]|jgi:GTP pyrophosphokinase|nr:RelA/SpoT family protein [Bacteroidales bacterium]
MMSETYIPNAEFERKSILKKYKELLSVMYEKTSVEQRKMIHKAFALACFAHRDMRRKSGEPYIYHPIAVAMVVCQEIGLGTTSVVCALLHDVVEDTDYTSEDIEERFGPIVAKIVKGLTKINALIIDTDISLQAENFKRIFLSMTDDVRVILIKLADRLHNMRTLNAMSEKQQLKISSETSFFFAPIAHRLGLYSIKSELEDFAMSYTDPIQYDLIKKKLENTEKDRQQLISDFVQPINESLKIAGINAKMSSRTKSVFSISEKMKHKKIPFEDVYDIFAVRYVFDSAPNAELEICWKIYGIVTRLYQINPGRLRDFINHPKQNGYQSLHVTAMSRTGKWVEVQIRSKRMDDIAEKGLAAHFKYKEENLLPTDYENYAEQWLDEIREVLKNNAADTMNVLDNIKLNLGLKMIYIFTPKGDMKTLPVGVSVLDFAYHLHTKIGNHCIGAKVNYNIVPNDYILKNGDQVEIITSKKQVPKTEWLELVITSKAKECIKEAIKVDYGKNVAKGKQLLQALFEKLSVEYNHDNIKKIMLAKNFTSSNDFFYYVSEEQNIEESIKDLLFNKKKVSLEHFKKKVIEELPLRSLDEILQEQLKTNPDIFTLDEGYANIKHRRASCCNPLPGDQVVGFQISADEIEVHQTNCPNAIEQMSKFGNRIIKAKWPKEQEIAFLSGFKIAGIDKKGLIKEIVDIISAQLDLNIRSFSIESKGSSFEGTIMLYIKSVQALSDLIETLRTIDNIGSIERI